MGADELSGETVAVRQWSEATTPPRVQEGLDRSLLYAGDFVLVRMALVDDVGFDAALVMQRISWRCECRPNGWRATRDQIAAETRLSRAKVQAATRLLRSNGYLKAWREFPWSSTLTWQPVYQGSDGSPPPEGRGLGLGSIEIGLPQESEPTPPPINDDSDDIQTTSSLHRLDVAVLETMFRVPEVGES